MDILDMIRRDPELRAKLGLALAPNDPRCTCLLPVDHMEGYQHALRCPTREGVE